MAMKPPPVQSLLLERRAQLLGLIENLRSELAHVDRELARDRPTKSVVLNADFLREVVYPLVARAGERGLTSKQIFEELTKIRGDLEYGNVRTFLARAKANGFFLSKQTGSDVTRYVIAPKLPSGEGG